MSTRRLLHSNNGRQTVPYALGLASDLSPLGATTFSRADATTCATQADATATWQTVLANVLRNGHYVGGVRTILLEPSAINTAWYNQAPQGSATWTIGAPGTCVNAVDVEGALSYCRIGGINAGGNISEGGMNPFTGLGNKIFTVFIRQDPTFSGLFKFDIIDNTVSTIRARVTITVSAAGVVTAAASNGGVVFNVVAYGNGQYQVNIAMTAIVAGNTHQIYAIRNIGGQTCDQVQMTGWQFTDFAYPLSPIKVPAGVAITRAVDALSLAGVPFAGTLFYHYYDLATAAWADAVAAYAGNVAIVPPTSRAYSHIAVVQGTQTAAQCKAILGGYFP